ncbi:hypothetical protein TrLO_g3071 [Triparma laevis f. longispina]|uniref:Uncharacterized protein n=1 Tax=Triparma laevis f. longispina TaxID=1714387 RepID=A0A9W7CIW0_9STRA|nr:hypothetical protein TrLO_g3071 [Triparma laevis f. longispina]
MLEDDVAESHDDQATIDVKIERAISTRLASMQGSFEETKVAQKMMQERLEEGEKRRLGAWEKRLELGEKKLEERLKEAAKQL